MDSDSPANSAPSSSSVTPDFTQTGQRTRAAFRYQDACVALEVVKLLLIDELIAVDVELATDVVIHTRNHPPEFVSIKKRDLGQTGSGTWQWGSIKNKKILEGLYSHWCKSDQAGTATIWSNAGLSGDAYNDLANVPSDLNEITPSLVNIVSKLIGEESHQTRAFLAKFNWPKTQMPNESDILDVLAWKMGTLLAHWRRSPNSAEFSVAALLNLIRDASDSDPRHLLQPTTAEAARTAEANLRRLRHITAADIRKAIEGASATDEGAVARPHSIKIYADPQFYAREAEIGQLESWWNDHDSNHCILYGTIGAGKTSVALEFAATRAQSTQVYIIDDSDPSGDPTAAWQQVERMATIDAGDCRDTLETLVIVDGVQSPVTLSRYSSRNWPFKLILTSTIMPTDIHSRKVEVPEWNQAEAIEFIEKHLGKAGASELFDRLGGNPLSLSQAHAVCIIESITPLAYLERYGTQLDSALDLGFVSDRLLSSGATISQRTTTANAIRIALTRLRQAHPECFQILQLAATMGPGAVDRSRFSSPLVVILTDSDLIDPDSAEIRASMTSRRDGAMPVMTDHEVNIAVNRLAHTCFVRLVGPSVSIHATTREFVLAFADPTLAIGRAVGSFFTAEGGLNLNLDSLREATSVISLASSLDLRGPGVYTLSLECAILLKALGVDSIAENLASTVEDWITRISSKLPVQQFTGIYWRLSEWYLASNQADNAATSLVNLTQMARQTGNLDLYGRSINSLSQIATAPSYRSLRSLLSGIMPPIDEAISYELDSFTADILVAHARLLWADGNLVESAELLTSTWARLNEIDPDHSWGRIRGDVATILVGLGQLGVPGVSPVDWAQLGLDQSRSDHGPEFAKTQRYIVERLRIADGYLEILELTEAATILEECDAKIREFHGSNRSLRSQCCSIRGRLRYLEHDFDGAVVNLKNAISAMDGAEPDHVPWLSATYFHLALAAEEKGLRDDAAAAALRCIELDTGRFGPHHSEVQLDLMALGHLVRSHD